MFPPRLSSAEITRPESRETKVHLHQILHYHDHGAECIKKKNRLLEVLRKRRRNFQRNRYQTYAERLFETFMTRL